MSTFFCKLLPPRPGFAQDMTGHEVALMHEHALHWTAGIDNGQVVTFGFVADPQGGYGIGVTEFPDEESVRAFTNDDPVIRAQAGFRYEIFPMPLGAARG